MRNETEIQYLPGVGPKRAEALMSEFGARYASELLRIYPFRYIDRTSFVRIADVKGESAYIQILASVRRITLFGAKGEIAQENLKELKFNTVKRMSVWVTDGSGEMEMTFFRGIKWMFGKLSEGGTFIFFGKPSEYNGRFSIVHVREPGRRPLGRCLSVRRKTEELRNHRKGNEPHNAGSTERRIGAGRGDPTTVYS